MNLLSENEPMLFLIGPSGVGKSSVLIELHQRGVIELTPSWTTRPARTDEDQNTIEHKFISEDEFIKLENDGFFLETLRLFNLSFRFGLPQVKKPPNNQVSALVLRTYLLPLMEKHYPNGITYAIEDEFTRVEPRLQSRKADGEPLGSRLAEYETEINQGRELAKRTFKNNSTIKTLADKIQKAIKTDFT